MIQTAIKQEETPSPAAVYLKKKEKRGALEKYSSSFIPCTVQSQEMHFSSDHQTPATKEWVAP